MDRRLLLLLLASLLVGCTKGTTEFTTLDSSNLPQPLFNGAMSTSLSATSDATTFSISGQCDSKIRSIQAQIIGVGDTQTDLNHVATSSPTVTCTSNGTFSFTLKSLADLGFTVAENQTYEVQLRGDTSVGLSNASTIMIKFNNPDSNAPVGTLVTLGGTESSTSSRQSTSTHFKAIVRVGTAGDDANGTLMSTHFKIKTSN